MIERLRFTIDTGAEGKSALTDINKVLMITLRAHGSLKSTQISSESPEDLLSVRHRLGSPALRVPEWRFGCSVVFLSLRAVPTSAPTFTPVVAQRRGREKYTITHPQVIRCLATHPCRLLLTPGLPRYPTTTHTPHALTSHTHVQSRVPLYSGSGLRCGCD